ncbi:pyrroline-5-carboxylate reductase [Burkholderia sp. D7]|nr:pyrroline-5-carboxylate reductase [Burkholderia sp. D7]
MRSFADLPEYNDGVAVSTQITRASMIDLGVIGTGQFASYFIGGLRRGGYDGNVLLAPRNAGVASTLARKHDCVVATSAQEVLAGADVILLSVRPEYAGAALANLRWEGRHTILSSMAGISIDDLRALLPGVGGIHLIMPGSYIETAPGPIPLYPPAPELMPLLSCAGDAIALPNEGAFNAAMVSLCASTWIYDLADVLASELERHGLEPDAARALTLGNIAGPASFALGLPGKSLLDISAGIATEGTFTKTGLDHLKACRFDAPWREAIARLAESLAPGA